MDREQEIFQGIKQQGILPLFYHADLQVCIGAVNALYAAGIRYIEFTNRGSEALHNFSSLAKQVESQWPGLALGIGTIKTSEEATQFIDAGAQFLVSPVFDHGVNDVAYMHKIPWIPGCMTPTEIHVAQQAGCTLVKLFPGNVLQPGFVSAIIPLFAHMEYVVTGGVEANEMSIHTWLKAGACAVGLGSKLISEKLLASGNFEQLQNDTLALIEIVRRAK